MQGDGQLRREIQIAPDQPAVGGAHLVEVAADRSRPPGLRGPGQAVGRRLREADCPTCVAVSGLCQGSSIFESDQAEGPDRVEKPEWLRSLHQRAVDESSEQARRDANGHRGIEIEAAREYRQLIERVPLVLVEV